MQSGVDISVSYAPSIITFHVLGYYYFFICSFPVEKPAPEGLSHEYLNVMSFTVVRCTSTLELWYELFVPTPTACCTTHISVFSHPIKLHQYLLSSASTSVATSLSILRLIALSIMR